MICAILTLTVSIVRKDVYSEDDEGLRKLFELIINIELTVNNINRRVATVRTKQNRAGAVISVFKIQLKMVALRAARVCAFIK